MRYKYSKYRPEDLDELDLEDLLSRLSDMLLGSGFEDPYGMPGDDDGHSLQALHEAILEALLSGALSDEMLERLLGKDWQSADDAEQRIDELIDRIIQKLQQQGYITPSPDLAAERERREGSGGGTGPRATSGSRSPTRAWTFSATARCGTSWDPWAGAASAATTRARWRRGSKPAVRRSRTSSATR